MGKAALRAVRAVMTAATLAMALAIAPSGTALAAAPQRKFVPPKVQQVPVLPRTLATLPAAGQRERVSAAAAAALKSGDGQRVSSSWPAAGTGTAILPAITGAMSTAALQRTAERPATAGGLPVTVARAGTSADAISQVQVRMLSHSAAVRAAVSGVLFTLTAPGGGTGPVRLSLGYGSFRNAGSADFASRLRLAELPACALITPQIPACQVQTPLRTVNDTASQTVSATARLATATAMPSLFLSLSSTPRVSPAVTQSQLVVAAVASPSGSNGDYTATSLRPSGTWTAGGAAGNFTWTYPVALPPPAGGSAPKVELEYNSATVDGKTAQTNNQSSEVGEGFALDNNYIERTYADCAEDPEGSISGKYDLCWAGNVVTLSLNGTSTQLVYDSSASSWHEENDNGDRIQYETGTAADTGNGTHDNGYWVVTTPDGTRYFFGKNKGPGWASGDPVTNSAWTVPVYGAHSGDPCYSSSGFASSSCMQAWRWNLDFVIGPNGNADTYYYTAETNYYGADGGTTGVKYTRGGYLTKIEYGLRDSGGSVYGSADTNPPDEVVFGTAQRCIPTSSFSCAASDFTTTNASYWPDTPVDQACTASQTCNNHAPTFWSQMRIDAITTQYWNGSKYLPVDKYALGQSFPSSGDPELELDTITRTGYSASGSSVTLPPADLTYQLMNNRIPGYNSEPDMAHWRLTNIETETGEIIDVTYSSTCTSSEIPASPSSNTTLCYPVYWTPVGDTSPILDYFNKYVVTEVSVQDGTAGDPSQVTQYEYVGSPAWHYDDNQVVKAKYRTYGQFRGYGTVKVLTGNPQNTTNGHADVQTETETTYYRGMYGDTLPGGSTSTTQVTDSLGDKLNDYSALAGAPLEVQKFNGNGGAQLTDEITERSVTQVTGTETVSGLPDMKASMTGVTYERDFTDLPGGGQNELTTKTTYDSHGRPVLVDKSGTGVPQTCTQTSYDDSSSAWIRNAVSEVIVAAQSCPSSPGSLTGSDIKADTRTYFDGHTSLTTAPVAGNATMQAKAVTNNGGTLSFATQWTKTYDALGRVTSSTDGRGDVTTTAYTPSGNMPLTQVQTTNALSQVSTETFDPGRGSLLTSTDAAGYETSSSYDPLGRRTAVWKPGRSQSGGAAANLTYSYQVSQTAPLAVTTKTLVDTGSSTDYVTSISIYDSLGNLRQTQTATEGGDSAVTDKFYDSHGWTWQTYNKYVVSGSPSTTLVSEAASAVNDRTVDTYDGTGQLIDQQDYNGDTLTDSTQTVNGGNQVTTIRKDAGGNVTGTPSATVTNVLGQQTETIQYASAPTVSGSAVSGGNPSVTATSYDAMGNKVKVTGPDGSTWTYAYDLLGEQVQAIDPDSGTMTTAYDAAGNVASVTDANGASVNYVYDALNRKTAEYAGSVAQGSGTQMAAWVWDTEKKGYLSYKKSFTSSGVYETGNLGYDSYGNVSGTWVYVPSGQPLAGTHETRNTYSSTGLLLYELPASGGGLPADSLSFTYDEYGNPVTEKGYDVYVSGAVWTPYHEISQIELGTGPSAAALTYSYDPQTRNVTGISLSDNQPAPQVDDTAYAYNADQQITKITDTEGAPGTAPAETQCFGYDGLSRLTQAWTSSDSCASNPVTDGNSTVSGPQPYWQSWTFDAAGDILSRTDHAVAGSQAGTDTATYGYGVGGHAHAISSVATVNSSTGATTTTAFTYDSDGQATSLGGQALAWNPGGTLKSAGTASYVYDADGNEIAETGPSGTTLFLPGEQLTQAPGGTVTGVRYYTFAGKIIGEGTGAGLWWTEQNPQGTLTVAADAGDEAAPVTRRTLTPYGTPAGGGAGAWPDNRTFLNDPYHSATGLVDIGARKYDPATGTFVSVDPVLDAGNPQTMNGYVYGAGDPVNNTDPTGKMLMIAGGGMIASPAYFLAHARSAPSITRAIQTYYPPIWHPQYTPVYVPHYTPPPPPRHVKKVVPPANTVSWSVGSLVHPWCGRFLYGACMTGSIAVSSAGAIHGTAAGVGDMTTRASALLRTGKSQGGKIMGLLSRSRMWRTVGRLGRSDAMELGGRFLLGAGAVATGLGVYDETHNAGEAVVDAAGDTAIGWGATAYGAEAGGEIGFALGGPAGALVGAGVGALVGAGVSLFASGAFNNAISDIASLF